MLLPVVIPRVFLINLHADQMRHHIGQAEVVVPSTPNHFHAAFGIGKLPNIPEKLPMFFLQPSEIEIGKRYHPTGSAAERLGLPTCAQPPRMTSPPNPRCTSDRIRVSAKLCSSA